MTRILKLILGCPFWLLGVGIGLLRPAMSAMEAGVEWIGRSDLYVDGGLAALAQAYGPTPACGACGSTAFRVICLQCDDDDAECDASLAGAECDLAGNEY